MSSVGLASVVASDVARLILFSIAGLFGANITELGASEGLVTSGRWRAHGLTRED